MFSLHILKICFQGMQGKYKYESQNINIFTKFMNRVGVEHLKNLCHNVTGK